MADEMIKILQIEIPRTLVNVHIKHQKRGKKFYLSDFDSGIVVATR